MDGPWQTQGRRHSLYVNWLMVKRMVFSQMVFVSNSHQAAGFVHDIDDAGSD